MEADETELRAIPVPVAGTEELERVPRNIRYSPTATPGFREPWSDSPDNPLSPAFVPLDKRGETGQARWWARFAGKDPRPRAGVFDP